MVYTPVVRSAGHPFNGSRRPQQYEESLGPGLPLCTVGNLDSGPSPAVFGQIARALQWLDKHRFVYSECKTADDFLHRHLVYDGSSQLTLVNKHLLMRRAGGGGARYTRASFIVLLLRAAFPVARTNPPWVIELARRLRAFNKSAAAHLPPPVDDGSDQNVLALVAGVVGSSGTETPDGSLRWACHLHPSRRCLVVQSGPTEYMHEVASAAGNLAQPFNRLRNVAGSDGRFQESLRADNVPPSADDPTAGIPVVAVGRSSWALTRGTFDGVVQLLRWLDANHLRYCRDETARHFVRAHVVCSAEGTLRLVNKQLLSRRTAGTRGGYVRVPFIISILRELFACITTSAQTVRTPRWAIELYRQLRELRTTTTTPNERARRRLAAVGRSPQLGTVPGAKARARVPRRV